MTDKEYYGHQPDINRPSWVDLPLPFPLFILELSFMKAHGFSQADLDKMHEAASRIHAIAYPLLAAFYAEQDSLTTEEHSLPHRERAAQESAIYQAGLERAAQEDPEAFETYEQMKNLYEVYIAERLESK